MFIPALKKDEDGKYTVCPVCAAIWVVLLVSAFFAFRAWKERSK